MRHILYIIGAAVALVAALLILVHTGLPNRSAYTGLIIAGERPVAPELQAFAPNFTLLNTDGDRIQLEDLRGSPVIVNFWATWCGPCIVEMPTLQSIFESHQASGLRVLAINMGESADTIKAWQQTHQLTYDLLVDEQQKVAAQYYLRGQPSTYVISPEGVITSIFFGPIQESTLNAALDQYRGTL
ncbi:MAG: alkyl hydroperoxide reductase [Anaerolineaceae bacterium]|nr:alkyl hydroperoxide reductase [Anaerolineaceae bacterium]